MGYACYVHRRDQQVYCAIEFRFANVHFLVHIQHGVATVLARAATYITQLFDKLVSETLKVGICKVFYNVAVETDLIDKLVGDFSDTFHPPELIKQGVPGR